MTVPIFLACLLGIVFVGVGIIAILQRGYIIKLEVRNVELKARLDERRSRQTNGGSTRSTAGAKPSIERPRTVRRDSADLMSTGRQHRIKRTYVGGDYPDAS